MYYFFFLSRTHAYESKGGGGADTSDDHWQVRQWLSLSPSIVFPLVRRQIHSSASFGSCTKTESHPAVVSMWYVGSSRSGGGCNGRHTSSRRSFVGLHEGVGGKRGRWRRRRDGGGGGTPCARALPTAARSVFFYLTSAGHDGLQTARSMHRLAHDPTKTWCSKVRRSHDFYLVHNAYYTNNVPVRIPIAERLVYRFSPIFPAVFIHAYGAGSRLKFSPSVFV